jgi:MerR family mercuric resistance operon transcriptional regulator
MNELTIAKAAQQAGVGIETIRFYERRGLIEQPLKPRDGGFRAYSPEQIKRIKFIRRAQKIGFSLQEIEELLSLRADPKADCSMVREQAVVKLGEVRQKIEELHQIGTALEALIAVCPGRGGVQACSILDLLAEPNHGPGPSAGIEGPLPSLSSVRTSRGKGRPLDPKAQSTTQKRRKAI